MRPDSRDSLEQSGQFVGWAALADVEKEFSANAVARACEETAAHLCQFAKLLHHPISNPEAATSTFDERTLLHSERDADC